jgi:hypothetical protein
MNLPLPGAFNDYFAQDPQVMVRARLLSGPARDLLTLYRPVAPKPIR